MTEHQQIGFTAAESTPSFPHDPKPPAGGAERRRHRPRRHGLRPAGRLRLRHRHAPPGRAGRRRRRRSTASTSPRCARRPGPRFFTGRNHHAVGMGFLADIPLAFPGYHARLPKTAAPLPRLLRDAGYSTLAVGKWHLTPRWQRSAAGPFDTWPLGLGLRALLRVPPGRHQPLDAQPRVRQPLRGAAAPARGGLPPERGPGRPGHPHGAGPAAGRAGQAVLPVLRARRHARPAPRRAANGSSRTGARSTTAGTPGASGSSPASSATGSSRRAPMLTERPEWVQRLGRPLGRRAAHARPPAGGLRRLPDPHRRPDRAGPRRPRDASGSSTTRWSWSSPTTGPAPRGARTAASTSTASPRTSASRSRSNLAHYDDWGGFRTYNHYSWGWAWAGNTPHRLWKRYTWLGGTRTPLIVHWPGHVAEPGDGAHPVRPRRST